MLVRMATWYKKIENARLCPTAQEYHNKTEDDALGRLTKSTKFC